MIKTRKIGGISVLADFEDEKMNDAFDKYVPFVDLVEVFDFDENRKSKCRKNEGIHCDWIWWCDRPTFDGGSDADDIVESFVINKDYIQARFGGDDIFWQRVRKCKKAIDSAYSKPFGDKRCDAIDRLFAKYGSGIR